MAEYNVYNWLAMATEYNNLMQNAIVLLKENENKQVALLDSVEHLRPERGVGLKKKNTEKWDIYRKAQDDILHSQKMLDLLNDRKTLEQQRVFYYLCRDFCVRKYVKVSHAILNNYILANVNQFKKIKSTYKKFEKIVKTVLGENWHVSIDRTNSTYVVPKIDYLSYKEKHNMEQYCILWCVEYSTYSNNLYGFNTEKMEYIPVPEDVNPETVIQEYINYINKADEIITECREKIKALHKNFNQYDCCPLSTLGENNFTEQWRLQYDISNWDKTVRILGALP